MSESEQSFKERIACDLMRLGFDVYVDRSALPNLKKFHGSKLMKSLRKPDMIVFAPCGDGGVEIPNSGGQRLHSPFGIEFKIGDSFGSHINTPIEQMRGYKDEPAYITGERTVSLRNIFLCTIPAIDEDILYKGSSSFPKTMSSVARYGIEWAIVRQLFSLTSTSGKKLYFGLFKKDSNGYYLKFPNVRFRLNPKWMFAQFNDDFKGVKG